jgi:hypothetical protein
MPGIVCRFHYATLLLSLCNSLFYSCRSPDFMAICGMFTATPLLGGQNEIHPRRAAGRVHPLNAASGKYGMSVEWWRAQKRIGTIRTVPFGRSCAIPPDEMARILREGLPPLRKPKTAA